VPVEGKVKFPDPEVDPPVTKFPRQLLGDPGGEGHPVNTWQIFQAAVPPKLKFNVTGAVVMFKLKT
jgi:hypothetical protein